MSRITEFTCGSRCWQARDFECSCSCGGANHGIHRIGGSGNSPLRTSRRKGVVYELIDVVDGQWLAKRFHQVRGNDPSIVIQSASGKHSGKNWDEVIKSGAKQPYLIWKRQGATIVDKPMLCVRCGLEEKPHRMRKGEHGNVHVDEGLCKWLSKQKYRV